MPPQSNPFALLSYTVITSLPFPELQAIAAAVANFNQALIAKWDQMFRNAIAEWPMIEKETFKLHAASLRSLLDIVEDSIAAVDRAAAPGAAPAPAGVSEKIVVS